jgi:hypothetical protein
LRPFGSKRRSRAQTTPTPSSLGFAALLCKELRRGRRGLTVNVLSALFVFAFMLGVSLKMFYLCTQERKQTIA